MAFDFLRCPCSGTGPGCGGAGGGVPLAGAVSTTGRLSAAGPANVAGLGLGLGLGLGFGVGAAPIVSAYAPAIQLHEFEPAFYTPEPVIAAVPYSPTYVAAVSPVVVNPNTNTNMNQHTHQSHGQGVGAAVAAGANALRGPANYLPPPPGPPSAVAPRMVTPCGCCSAVFSPLPPSGLQAWRQLIQDTNRPYEQLMQCGYTTGCAGLRQW